MASCDFCAGALFYKNKTTFEARHDGQVEPELLMNMGEFK